LKTIGVGIIGLGVGEQHLKSYASIPDVEVKAICDIDPQRLAEISQKYKVAEAYNDYRRVTEHANLDAISICSYDDVHAEQAISALSNGKHVMVEKPVALTKRDAEKLLCAKVKSGRFMSSNLILRQSPRFKELKRQIEAGEFGDIFCIEGDYIHQILWKIITGWRGQMDYYSTIFGGGIHLIDLMRWLLQDEVVEVCGMSNKILTHNSDYRFDDTFINIFRFEKGALGKCLTTFGPQRTKFHSLNVYGTRKTFINDIPYAKLFTGDCLKDESVIETPYPGVEKGDLLPEFIDSVRNGKEPEVSSRDIFRVMDICFAASEAAASGQTVKVDYLV
jgi:predicted dehydrogenase